jgi:Raf kinase inhibitor-like YbhB/YbcL family protein
MNQKRVTIALMTMLILTGCVQTRNNETLRQGVGEERANTRTIIPTDRLIVSSPTFDPNTEIPRNYTCDGKGINPPLRITGVPQDTESLALIMDDPDAPKGTMTHWVVWNIPPNTEMIHENTVPNPAVLGTNSSGQYKYWAPCPAEGRHHYHFRLYALDTMLTIPMGSTRDVLETAMKGHIIQQSELVGTFHEDIHDERKDKNVFNPPGGNNP